MDTLTDVTDASASPGLPLSPSLRRRSGATHDAVSLTDFAHKHSLALTRYAFLLCGDQHRAEDLVQDAFLSLYRRFGETLPIAAPLAYARKTVTNRHLAWARTRSSGEIPVMEVPERPVTPHYDLQQEALRAALGELPDRQRAALVMRYFLDLPDREIAATLSCRRGTVRSLVSRALSALRADPSIEGAGYDA